MQKIGRNDPCICGSGKKFKHCCMHSNSSAEKPSQALMLQTALEHHQSGRLHEAEILYRAILETDPTHSDALHFLGLIAHQAGHSQAAIELLTRAISSNPQNPTYYCNLGCVLQQQGILKEAVPLFQGALILKPEFPEAHYNLGLVLQEQGLFQEAIASYQRALTYRGDYAEAYGNLGYALQQQGKADEAVRCFRKAIDICPRYPEAHFNLGNALKREGRFEEAIASYRQAILYKPDYADAHNNLGTLLRQRKRFEEAIESYQAALDSKPQYAEAYSNLSAALHDVGRMDEAVVACRKALAINALMPEALYNLGNALQELGNLNEAISSYQRAISIRPEYAEAYANLGRALQEQGKISDAVACYEKALELKPDSAEAFSNLIYLHAFAHDISPLEQVRIATGWERVILSEQELAEARSRRFACIPRSGRQLRLGIVSAELGQHAVAEFLQPLLENLDRKRFHLTLYPTVMRTGPRAERIRKLADQYTPLVDFSDGEAAAQIRSDNIDVLMDTTSHTNKGRLAIFAHRAAPVQCTYIGFWASTGLSQMDWYICDSLTSPCDTHFSERLWRLPRPAIAYWGNTSLPESDWHPAADGTVWLGSFNKYSKIREECLALWAKMLHSLPEAQLLLEDRSPFDNQLHPRLLTELARNGIGAERVEFSPCDPGWQKHMLLYNRLDIALDTVPFNSGTTACDALWMGVPLVTLEGDWSGGRMAAATLRGLGRLEWIARTEDEYVQIVTTLARDLELRKQLRKTQRAQMCASPLCNADDLALALQEAFEGMYDDWAARQK